MKRTTLLLSENHYRALKRLAAELECSMSTLVDRFMREGLQRTHIQQKSAKSKLKLPTYPMGASRVNIADRDQLLDLLDLE